MSRTVVLALLVNWWINPAYWTVVELSMVVLMGIPAIKRNNETNEQLDKEISLRKRLLFLSSLCVLKIGLRPSFIATYLHYWRQLFRERLCGSGFFSTIPRLQTAKERNIVFKTWPQIVKTRKSQLKSAPFRLLLACTCFSATLPRNRTRFALWEFMRALAKLNSCFRN